jgi:Flp pilus assembly protein TadG
LRAQAGQSLVETALILAAFMGLLLGMTGVGELIFVRQTLADRASQAARWGAMNSYNPTAIRDVVRFGTATPEQGQAPFFGLTAAAIEVSNPGCPGVQCRVSVAIPEHGIRSVEPMEDAPDISVTAPAATAPAATPAAVSNP